MTEIESRADDDYEAICETLDILTDDEVADELRRSIKEAKAGKTIAWDEAKAAL